MKTFKSYRENIQCPVCLKKFETKQAFGSHFRHYGEKHQIFLQKYKAMIIRLYLKGWTRQELKFNQHMLFSNRIQNKIISEYLKEHPEDRQIKPSRMRLVKCDNCHKSINIMLWKVKTYKHHFCGEKCRDEFQIKNPITPWNKGLSLKTHPENKRLQSMSKKKKLDWKKEPEKHFNKNQANKINNPEWYKNICKANREIVAPQNIGRKRTAATCKKLSIAMTGKKFPPPSPETHRKRVMAMNQKPNGLEYKFIQFINKYNLPYQYNDGKEKALLIERKIPDFIHKDVESTHKIIELFGSPFHNPDKAWFELRSDRSYSGTKKYYQNHNYNCLILWDKEFRGINWEEKLLAKVNKFEEKTSQDKTLYTKEPTLNNQGAILLQIQTANM